MKTVLITGAGGRLGSATVQVFSSAGWQVAAIVSAGKTPGSPLGDKEVGELAARITYFEANLEDEASTGKLMQEIIDKFGGLDAAIMTVGGFEAGGLDKTDGAALKRMYTLNFETAYYTAKPLAAHMLQGGSGKLFFIGARPALDAKAGKGLMAYGLSKSLLFKLAEYLNATANRVMAHVVVFQALDTPQNRSSMPNADRSSWVTPESAARRMLSLSDQAGGDVVVEIKNS